MDWKRKKERKVFKMENGTRNLILYTLKKKNVAVISGDIIEVEEALKGLLHISGGAWLAQLAEHVTLDLGVVRLSPMSGVEII